LWGGGFAKNGAPMLRKLVAKNSNKNDKRKELLVKKKEKQQRRGLVFVFGARLRAKNKKTRRIKRKRPKGARGKKKKGE